MRRARSWTASYETTTSSSFRLATVFCTPFSSDCLDPSDTCWSPISAQPVRFSRSLPSEALKNLKLRGFNIQISIWRFRFGGFDLKVSIWRFRFSTSDLELSILNIPISSFRFLFSTSNSHFYFPRHSSSPTEPQPERDLQLSDRFQEVHPKRNLHKVQTKFETHQVDRLRIDEFDWIFCLVFCLIFCQYWQCSTRFESQIGENKEVLLFYEFKDFLIDVFFDRLPSLMDPNRPSSMDHPIWVCNSFYSFWASVSPLSVSVVTLSCPSHFKLSLSL